MERMTKRLASGAADYAVNMAELTHPQKSAYRQKCIKALDTYEETGLEPEEVRSLRIDMAIIKAMFGDADVKRMKELCEADKEGRVVVLQGDYTEVGGEEALRRDMYYCGTTNNPVTRYTADAIAEKLTRAEAEGALDRIEV